MPNRVLRDGLLTSDVIQGLTLPAETFYVHLLLKLDDFGRKEYTKALKAEVFPCRDIRDADVARLLAECEKAGAVRRYEQHGKRYMVVPKVDQPRAKASKFPQPPSGVECWRETISGLSVYGREHTGVNVCKHLQADANICKQTQADANICKHVQADANICPVSVFVSDCVVGIENPPPASAGTPRGGPRSQRFVQPSLAELTGYMSERGWDDPARMAAKFTDHYAARGWRIGKANTPMKDWRAAVRTWENSGDGVKYAAGAGAEAGNEWYSGPCGVCGKPGHGLIVDGEKYEPVCADCKREMDACRNKGAA